MAEAERSDGIPPPLSLSCYDRPTALADQWLFAEIRIGLDWNAAPDKVSQNAGTQERTETTACVAKSTLTSKPMALSLVFHLMFLSFPSFFRTLNVSLDQWLCFDSIPFFLSGILITKRLV